MYVHVYVDELCASVCMSAYTSMRCALEVVSASLSGSAFGWVSKYVGWAFFFARAGVAVPCCVCVCVCVCERVSAVCACVFVSMPCCVNV